MPYADVVVDLSHHNPKVDLAQAGQNGITLPHSLRSLSLPSPFPHLVGEQLQQVADFGMACQAVDGEGLEYLFTVLENALEAF